MKTLLALSAVMVFFSSCKKDDKAVTPSTPATVVKYTIQPIDENIIDVRYNNNVSEFIIESGSGELTDGSYQFSVTSKPFAAKAGLRFEDTFNSIDEYEVSIYVDGSLKARDTIVNTGPSSNGEGYVEYTVE